MIFEFRARKKRYLKTITKKARAESPLPLLRHLAKDRNLGRAARRALKPLPSFAQTSL
jgi:hypothetical protein